jgi:hypothetical protein
VEFSKYGWRQPIIFMLGTILLSIMKVGHLMKVLKVLKESVSGSQP